MPKTVSAIRWTVQLASSEFNHGRESITKGLKANGIIPGEDGRYSTCQIADAIYGSSRLERQAREAKYRAQIDQAEIVKHEREVQEGKLGYVSTMRDFIVDLILKVRQIIENSKLSEHEQREVLNLIRDTPVLGDEDGKFQAKWRKEHPEFGPWD